MLALGASNRSDPLLRSSQRMAYDSLMKAPMQTPEAMVMTARTAMTLTTTGSQLLSAITGRSPVNQTGRTVPDARIIRSSVTVVTVQGSVFEGVANLVGSPRCI